MKRRKRLNILVVENHDDTLEALKMYLELDGHIVQTATTMQEALGVAAQHQFDLVMTDIGLPDGDGWDLMRQLRERGPVRAIAMTGYGWKEDVEKSRAVGFAAHLLKPLKVDHLEAALRRMEKEIAAESPPAPKKRKLAAHAI